MSETKWKIPPGWKRHPSPKILVLSQVWRRSQGPGIYQLYLHQEGVKIGLKPGNRSTWESHKCSGTQWEQFINTETNLLAWNTMRAVEELSLCPGIVEGAQNAAITEELYRRSPRRQKNRKKKLQVQPCIGWSSNYWSYGLGKKCYRVLEYYRVHI